MNRQSSWSPTQKVLFTSLVPVAAIVGALALLSLVRSAPTPSQGAAASPGASTENSTRDLRDTSREAYRDCLKSMGGDFGRTRLRGRFSAPPDMNKIREAMSVCRSILGSDGSPPPAPRGPVAPPIA
jgi:hypothetical protein